MAGRVGAPTSASGSSRANAMEIYGDEEYFFLRYYVGHKSKFGHELLEFEFRPDGKLRHANNSNYENDTSSGRRFASPPLSSAMPQRPR